MSASVGSTTREAVTRMYGRNKGILGATSTSSRLEERPLLSETEARLMDPDEVIILASPQHPIKAQRIKYYDDPLFKEMVERQEGRAFPYPPSVEGAGPWAADFSEDETKEHDEPPQTARMRSRRREARAMQANVSQGSAGTADRTEDLDRDDGIPAAWEEVLDRQQSFIEELLGD